MDSAIKSIFFILGSISLFLILYAHIEMAKSIKSWIYGKSDLDRTEANVVYIKNQALVHFINQYGGFSGSYLDTCGKSNCGNKGVSLVETYPYRENGASGISGQTSTWKISLKTTADSGVIYDGDTIHIINHLAETGEKTYLDTCNRNDHGGYRVQTTNDLERDIKTLTSTWKIKLKNGNNLGKSAIKHGDLVYIVSQYGKISYLDAFGDATCHTDGLYRIETTPNLERDQTYQSSTWKIELKSSEH